MAEWKEPKSDYVATDQVVPEIFNDLAENEKYLKEKTCPIELQPKSTTVTTKVPAIVLVEV